MAESIPPIETIEQLLNVAVRFGGCTADARFDRLAELTCAAFDANGCIIVTPAGDFSAFRGAAQAVALSQDNLDRRIHKLLVLSMHAAKPVFVFDLPVEGGPAIVAKAPSAAMLICRDGARNTFSQQDARFAGALWRACAGVQGTEEREQPGKDSLTGRLKLSPRVRQVLGCLMDGLAEKQIATELHISPHTVHMHIKNLYRRIGVNSRSQLLLRCLKLREQRVLVQPSVEDPAASRATGALCNRNVARSSHPIG